MAGTAKICIFGPQGSGKGTQAAKLSVFLQVPHISPGDIFRKEIAAGSALGQKVGAIIKSGHLVTNEITNTLIAARLARPDCARGFILDGYPRNEAQAEALDKISELTHVLLVDIPDEESVRRISRRRVCEQCGRTQTQQDSAGQQCVACGSALKQRDDDKPESLQKRLRIYHAVTAPLFARYKQQGFFYQIDGLGTIEEVWQRVKAVFEVSK